MTLYLNASSLVWAALAALFVARYLGPWVSRLIVVHEARYASTRTTGQIADPMPEDLMGYAQTIRTGNSEMDDVLQQQIIGVLHEQYAALGSWDKVRAWSAANMGVDIRQDGWGNV